MSFPVTAPSGLKGSIRKLKVKEANILANSASARRGSTFDDMLRGCWLGTDDPGPYPPTVCRVDGTTDWAKVLVADRFHILMQMRIATYGPIYTFKYQCDRQSCRESFDWEIDLVKDLQYRQLPAESIDRFKTDNRFETTIPSIGRKCWFRLQTGEMEQKASQLARQRKVEVMTLSLASRIIEIDGVEGNDKLRFLDELDMDDAVALIDKLDEVDGGIDTDVNIECTACANSMAVKLPFEREFWLPLKRRSPSMEVTTP